MNWFFQNIRAIMGISIVYLSFIFLFSLLFVVIPAENKAIVYTSAGIFLGLSGAVANYYFGSSKNESDKAKVEQINKITTSPSQER